MPDLTTGEAEVIPRVTGSHLWAVGVAADTQLTLGFPAITEKCREVEALLSLLVSGKAVVVDADDLARLEQIRIAAVVMVDWINGPNSQDLFGDVAKASGVHAGHIRALTDAFGREHFEWADNDEWPNSYEPRWLSPAPTQEDAQ